VPDKSKSSDYNWYMLAVGGFVIPGGIQTVLFPWLIVVELQESAERLGIAQTASMLPGLVIILFAGLVADRVGSRKILIVVHILAALPVLLLALLIFNGYLFYPVLLIYALLAGTIGSFSQPARDALLNQVAGNQIQRTVTVSLGITFAAQIVGFALASQADRYGAVMLLIVQAMILLFGGWAAFKLNKVPSERMPAGGKWQQIREGLMIVYHSERMWPRSGIIMAVHQMIWPTFSHPLWWVLW
jgi:MFS family permease